MLAGSIRRMTDEYTGSADTLGIHRPFYSSVYQLASFGVIDRHRFPIEISLIFNAAPVWSFCEVHLLQQRLQIRIEFMKTRRIV